jgi:hypothetical protein
LTAGLREIPVLFCAGVGRHCTKTRSLGARAEHLYRITRTVVWIGIVVAAYRCDYFKVNAYAYFYG